MAKETESIRIVWRETPGNGRLVVVGGALVSAQTAGGLIADGAFQFDGGDEAAWLTLMVTGEEGQRTIVSVQNGERSFGFFLSDAQKFRPMVIGVCGAAVTTSDDGRSYEELLQVTRLRDARTALDQIDAEPEDSFTAAARETMSMTCPTWLGVGRDVRLFEFGLRQPMQYTDWVQPRYHGYGYLWQEPDKRFQPARFGFATGRGWGCSNQVERRLDEGVLPILHVNRVDDRMRYEYVAFAAHEPSAAGDHSRSGTHHLVADLLSIGNALTDQQQAEAEALRDAELLRDRETVLCCRITAVNTDRVPRHAFFKAVHPVYPLVGSPENHQFDGQTGFGRFPEAEEVFAINRLDGEPMSQQETAVLVAPGASCVFEFYLPHRPIPASRAEQLANADFDALLDNCRSFWRARIAEAAQIQLPEKRIQQMLQAGQLHVDMVAYGREPEGPLNHGNGLYGALGSETTVNLLYLDSLGLHDQVERGLEHFLAKQHPNGLMQNYRGYMLETGAILWAMGEHYRYTRDDQWVRRVQPHVDQACEFILDWRERNKREELRGKGYGLLEGRVADPQDEHRIFMLNGYACLGLVRAAEMLEAIDPQRSQRLADEARRFKADIRQALFESQAISPIVPLGDGTWAPTCGPWVDQPGPTCLFARDQEVWTHGAMTLRDDVLGPMHLVFQEIFDPNESAVTALLDFHAALFYSRNFSFSQPYYSRHPWVHLRRRETRRFLKAWYTGVASLADRQTYTWWEHYYQLSPHKTHEECEFYMQTRWMLYLEEGDTLALLRGVPRAWLKDGETIRAQEVVSYFGRLSFEVTSHIDRGWIEARVDCDGERCPARVELRLPHPRHHRAVEVEGGRYEPEQESVWIEPFTGSAHVRLDFTPKRAALPRNTPIRVKLAVAFERAPQRGRFVSEHAEIVSGGLFIGWGEYSADDASFVLTSGGEPAQFNFALAIPPEGKGGNGRFGITDTSTPFGVDLHDVLDAPDSTIVFGNAGVTVRAEIDRLAMV